MATTRVDPDDLAIVLIDVQPYFLDGWMAGASEPLLSRLEYLLALATAYELPCLATFEQPIERKGWLPERLEPFFPTHAQRVTKWTFDCCGEPEFRSALDRLGRGQIAVAGGETDVCVLQSVLGLIAAGKEVFLLEDALFSSEPHPGPAVRRMERAGALPSGVKILAYELRRSVASPTADALLRCHRPELVLPNPESLPARPPAW